MILKTEYTDLYNLLKSFYKVTGIKTAVYDSGFNEILAFPREDSEICRAAQKKCPGGCEKSNKTLFEKCAESGGVVIEKCHAGLIEAAAPLTDNGGIFGYIMYGQIMNEPRRYSVEQLEAVSDIFRAVASYMMQKKYVYADEKPIIYSVMEYISENLHGHLSVDSLCRKFSVSKAQLYKLSKPYMPDGIAEFIKCARLAKACELLEKTDKPLVRVAEESGFSDKEYFLRVFKAKYGVSAGSYRKKV